MKAERVTRELWDGPNVQAQLWTWNPSLCARNTLFPPLFHYRRLQQKSSSNVTRLSSLLFI